MTKTSSSVFDSMSRFSITMVRRATSTSFVHIMILGVPGLLFDINLAILFPLGSIPLYGSPLGPPKDAKNV